MDAKQLLEQLVESGKKLAQQGLQQGSELIEQGKGLAQQGIDYAQEQLPPPGPERDALMTKLGIGAAAAGVMGLLVGTQSGRRLLSPIVKIGSVAALGGLAYKLYSDWQGDQNSAPEAGQSIDQLDNEQANQRSQLLLRSMISAAKADGVIDGHESEVITSAIESSGLEQSTSSLLLTEIPKPIDVAGLAAEVDSRAAACEVYLVSIMVAGQPPTAIERDYLDKLSSEMKLEADLVRQLETQAFAQ